MFCMPCASLRLRHTATTLTMRPYTWSFASGQQAPNTVFDSFRSEPAFCIPVRMHWV